MTDEEFVKSVMSQLPKTDYSLYVMWGIRIAAFVVALLVLIPFRSTFAPMFYALVAFLTPEHILALPTAVIPVFGSIFAALTLIICKQKQLI